MTNEEIYKKISDTYASEKGKGFITHLLRSFFPVNKAHYEFFKDEKKQYKCCITGEELFTKEDLFNITMTEEGKQALMEDFKLMAKSIANGDKSYTHPDSLMKIKEQIKPLAVISEQSNKCLSQQAFEQLQNFYMSEMLKGNKHINWIANNERAKEVVEKGKKEGFVNNKKQEKVVHKVMEHSTLKLGDFDALKELRKKLAKQENV